MAEVAQLVRAPVCGTGGRGFNTHLSPHYYFFVNIFTLHAMDILCHKKPWIHQWLKDQLPDTQKYISNGSNFSEWKNQPGVALFIYAQLAREYGWESYKSVFRIYDNLKPKLKYP